MTPPTLATSRAALPPEGVQASLGRPGAGLQQSISLLICALGGEGGGVLTDWLIDIARRAGYAAQATSIPGVAQRTGATTYYVEVFPTPIAQLGGKRPVFSLSPVPGALDAIVSSELLETSRQIANGMATADRTRIFSNTARTFTTAERMVPGDGRLDDAPLLALVRAHALNHHLLDMQAMAQQTGTVVSAVMLGAVAGSGLFPFQRADFEAVVGAGGGAPAQASLRGFALAFDAVQGQSAQAAQLVSLLSIQELNAYTDNAERRTFIQNFPAETQEVLRLGHARVLDYQNAAYAKLYQTRMQAVLAADQQSDPSAAQGFATTQEVARWLALWMAFDDIVRVADLKSRASRLARVRAEAKAQGYDLLKVYEHFKPGVPELAGLLPEPLAKRLLAWDRQRVAKGLSPWAVPLKIGTHTVLGMMALRTLAACKPLRTIGSRYAHEQALIEEWLNAIQQGAQRHANLGLEIARCGQLIKGYGSTNERGKDHLLHVVQHLAHLRDAQAAADAIRQARQAALTDDSGKLLDGVLRQHGAAPRPIKEQPIRWMRRPSGASAAVPKT
jgi:indolepyruvate ferredoxin oxidoreductase beta subunit